MSNVMLDAALAYAARGWHVFPLSDHTKIPIKGSAGVDDATVDRGQIHHWWTEHPNSNIGISCGPSGLVVLDLDDYKDGADATAWLASHPELEDTMSVRTGSGGTHYYFLAPRGSDVGNGTSKIHDYVDHRGQGGYVLAPPSITDEPYELVNDDDPRPLPFWVVERLHQAKRPPAGGNDVVRLEYDGNVTRYGQKCLDDWNARMDSVVRGRNDELNRCAFAGGQVIAGGHLDETTVRSVLTAAAQRASGRGDHPLTDQEIEATLTSGIEQGKLRPIYIERNPDPRAYASPTVVEIHPQVRMTRIGEGPPPEPSKFLWGGRLTIGALNLFAGTGGIGKSFATLRLAIDLANGEGYDEAVLPGQYDHGSTVVISYEDTTDDMASRLAGMGYYGDGPCGCIQTIDGGAMFQDAKGQNVGFKPEHIDLLVDALRSVPELRLVVIDPIMAFIGQGADTNQDNQVRASLDRLVTLARELDVAVVAVAHTRKGQIDWSQPADSISGSVAFKNLARSVLMAVEDPKHEAQKYIFHVKVNRTSKASGIQYLFEAGEIVWLKETDPAFLRVIAARSQASPLQHTCWWVEAYFAKAEGPVRASALVAEAKAAGYGLDVLKDAVRRLGVIKTVDDRGVQWLTLPLDRV